MIGQVLRVFDHSRPAAHCLMVTLFWVEQPVDLKHKIPQHPRLSQVAKDLAQPATFSPIKVFRSGHALFKRHHLPVRTLLVLLHRGADSPQVTGLPAASPHGTYHRGPAGD